MTTSEPDASRVDQPGESPPRQTPAPADQEQPVESQGFWRQPTEPMEREHQPLQPHSQEDGQE